MQLLSQMTLSDAFQNFKIHGDEERMTKETQPRDKQAKNIECNKVGANVWVAY